MSTNQSPTKSPAAKRARTDDSEHEVFLKAAVEVAREAGRLIHDAFDKPKEVMNKATSVDLVTATDQAAEKLIFEKLREKFPDHAFIGEESVAAGSKCELTDAPTWIVDPLDGTTNFVHRFPFVAVSIALAIEQKPVVGVVYNCILDEMYTAIAGSGEAQWNGKPIHCTGETNIGAAIVGTEFGSDRSAARLEILRDNLHSLAGNPNAVHSIRCLGSAALNMCLVARGSMDGYFETGIHCWDYGAGIVIVREAGGVVLDPQGGDVDIMARKVLCAGTRELAASITASIKPIPVPRDDA